MSRARPKRARRSRYHVSYRLTRSVPAAVLAALLLAVLVGVTLTYKRFDDFIHTTTGRHINPIGEVVQAVEPAQGTIAYKLKHGQQVNVLLLGMGGEQNDAPYLTDSIMAVTIDPATNRVTSDAQPLVENSTEAFVYFSRPRLSPDGRLVAFGASGGPNLNLSADIGGIGAGRRSLFATGLAHGPGWDIWTVGVDGDGLRQVTQFDYEDDLAVAWSPDGEWLAAFGPRALYLIPVRVSGPATPIGRGGLGEPDWIAAGLIGESSPP